MAKINEEVIMIKISTLSADDAGATSNISDDLMDTLKSVALEFANDGAVVEVTDGE